MAKEARSWEANDGSLHKTECDAVRRDLEMLIQASPCAENLPYCKTMLGWMTGDARNIAESLIAYADACPQDAVAAEPAKADHASHCQSVGNADLACDCGGPNRGEDEDNGR